MDCAQRHVGLASSAFCHDPRRFGFAQVLRGPGNGKRLGRESFPQQGSNRRRNGVFRALERGIGFDNARA
jgi:hypothetical protein